MDDRWVLAGNVARHSGWQLACYRGCIKGILEHIFKSLHGFRPTDHAKHQFPRQITSRHKEQPKSKIILIHRKSLHHQTPAINQIKQTHSTNLTVLDQVAMLGPTFLQVLLSWPLPVYIQHFLTRPVPSDWIANARMPRSWLVYHHEQPRVPWWNHLELALKLFLNQLGGTCVCDRVRNKDKGKLAWWWRLTVWQKSKVWEK